MPHLLNCTCCICYICQYLLLIVVVIAGEKKRSSKTGHRLRPPAVAVLDVHRGLRCQQLLGALHVAVDCCNVQRSGTSAPAEWRSRLRGSVTGDRWAPCGRGRPGRPRRRPSPRGTPRPPGGRCWLPSAALTSHRGVGRGCRRRGAGGPGRPGGRRRPPRGRCGRLGARRNETEMTMFFFLFFPLDVSDFSKSKSAKSATIEIWLNQLETWTSWTLEFLVFNVMELEVQLQIYF